jgi:hypothetical protein
MHMKGFIEVRSYERQFLVAVSNITSVADNRSGTGSVINLQFSIDMHGDCIKTDLSLAKVKALIVQAQEA